MKIITYFLPQYHEIDENNEWWGKGFTEWTNIKKAKKLYKNHQQPLIPNNYYDLSEKKTMIEQTNMSKKYGVYGFCYYHYWFSGKLLLEKPAENLLKWKEIDQKFCFCWANHSWRRTWNYTNELLIEQKYGDIQEWQAHFDYLKPFFEDERYIKIDNKPVFMVYDINAVKKKDERITFYNEQAKKNGFNGIFLIESINNGTEISNDSENLVLREPTIAIQTNNKKNILKKIESGYKRNKKNNFFKKPQMYSYAELNKQGLKESKKIITQNMNKTIFLGGFTGWDSTPRHGKHGFVVESNHETFYDHLFELKKTISSYDNVSEYVFLNAWNEWAEGMYLEPDEKNGYRYLESIARIIGE